ncbi:MAG: YchF/TatD family DNA exonuclease [bacterium]|nr:YchF/TatD family DNA exonuclease [bacterium]
MYIDTHAHLDFPELRPHLSSVLANAHHAGVEKIITIGIDDVTNENALQIAADHDEVYAAVGWHPHDSEKADHNLEALIRRQADHPKVVAIGEIGLDYFRNRSPQEKQREIFTRMLGIASELTLPVVIHCREAFSDTFDILRNFTSDKLTGVFHCFSGGITELKQVLNLGFFVSFTGNVTYKNSALTSVVAAAPIERILLETDCPFLTPQPHRGKRNEPAYIPLIADQIARTKGLSLSDIARITTANSYRLFGVGEPPAKSIVYPIRNSLYIALTSRCTNTCRFCPRATNPVVKGYNLGMDDEAEPTSEQVIQAIGDPLKYEEVVFCGFGEPTIRLDVLLQVARWLKSKGVQKVRINTNGHGNLIHRRNIVPELSGLIDSISISLNEPTSERYQKIMQSEFGESSFQGVIDFTRACVGVIPEVVITAVSYPAVDAEAIKNIAERVGVKFRLRAYNDLG